MALQRVRLQPQPHGGEERTPNGFGGRGVDGIGGRGFGVLPLTLIFRGFLHAPGGRLALRPFPLLEIPLLSVRTVEMGVPLLNNRSFENCHRFRINHVVFPGKFRFANRTFEIRKRRSSENGAKICFWHERAVSHMSDFIASLVKFQPAAPQQGPDALQRRWSVGATVRANHIIRPPARAFKDHFAAHSGTFHGLSEPHIEDANRRSASNGW